MRLPCHQLRGRELRYISYTIRGIGHLSWQGDQVLPLCSGEVQIWLWRCHGVGGQWGGKGQSRSVWGLADVQVVPEVGEFGGCKYVLQAMTGISTVLWSHTW